MAYGDVGAVQYFNATDTDDGDYSAALVAAVTGKRIRVLSLVISVMTTAGTVTLKSGSDTIFAQTLALGAPLVIETHGRGICQTASGEALVGSNGTGVDSFISGTCVLVDA